MIARVWSTTSQLEAECICSLLQGFDIGAIVESSYAFYAIGFPTSLTPLIVVVPGEEAQTARGLIAQYWRRLTGNQLPVSHGHPHINGSPLFKTFQNRFSAQGGGLQEGNIFFQGLGFDRCRGHLVSPAHGFVGRGNDTHYLRNFSEPMKKGDRCTRSTQKNCF